MSATGYRVWGLGPGAYDVPLMAIEDQPWGEAWIEPIAAWL